MESRKKDEGVQCNLLSECGISIFIDGVSRNNGNVTHPRANLHAINELVHCYSITQCKSYLAFNLGREKSNICQFKERMVPLPIERSDKSALTNQALTHQHLSEDKPQEPLLRTGYIRIKQNQPLGRNSQNGLNDRSPLQNLQDVESVLLKIFKNDTLRLEDFNMRHEGLQIMVEVIGRKNKSIVDPKLAKKKM